MNLKRKDSTFLARDSDAEDLQVARSEGSFLYDAHGKKYIDFVAGWCVGNLGWANKEIERSIRQSKRPNYVYPYYLYRPWADLAELLSKVAPGNLTRSFRATSGTEAVDIALQIAMASTGRRKFVSIEDSYHGNSVATVSIASSDGRKPYKNLLTNCLKVKPPLDAKAIERVDKLLRRRDVAAFIMEPVIIALGVYVPEKEFMSGLQRLCRKYGSLLIADEVATGFGRTGRLFACEHFDLEPDILCLAKAITGGYAPMGATITTEKVARSIEGKTSFYSTYGWHPLSVDAALANLRYLMKHKARLLNNVNATSNFFRRRLSAMKFRGKAKINIQGLAIGVELKTSDYAQTIIEKCCKGGLVLESQSEVLTMFPALTIDRKTASQGLDILAESL